MFGQSTIQMLSKAIKSGDENEIFKAFTNATGLVNYDLQPVARTLYPVITPLRNMLPRVAANGGTATHWKAITGININNVSPGVAEGERSGVIATTLKDYVATYKTLGLEDYVTFEADLSAEGFDDAKNKAIEGLLRSVMIAEEKTMLGGNATLALGQTPTPTLADIGSGGSIGTGIDIHVSCIALSHDGYMRDSVTGGVARQITRTNADGTTTSYGGGSAIPSADESLTTGANSDSVSAFVTPVQGAVAYAWYWGATAGGATLGAITTINSILITTATGAGTQTATAAAAGGVDYSRNTLVYDGLLYIALGAGQESGASASGALIAYQATGTPGTGTALTANGAGGITEIETDLKSFWDNFNLSPTHIFVNSQELTNITNKVIAGGGSPLFRFTLDGAAKSLAEGTLQAGAVIGTYLNKFTMGGGNLLKVQLHPNMVAGTIMYYSDQINYPLSNVANVCQFKSRREYYQIEWPLRTRKYEYGVYVDGVLQHYFPPSMGVRFNIANG